MRELWNKLVEKASDAGEFVENVSKNGIHFLRSSVGKLPLLTSTTADDTDQTLEVDETHYFLVPFRAHDSGYTLYTMRSLPPGVGPTNSLPKARIFHLHDKNGLEVLESFLVQSTKERTLADTDQPEKEDLADHLDSMGEQIDRESFKITGGLLIIGGAVAFVNPVVGAGIAAKALFPSLGAKASKLGLKFAGQKMRDRAEKKRDRKAEKAAVAEVKKLKPELYLNPLLTQLEEAIESSEAELDPILASAGLVQQFPNTRYLRISLQAILSVYEEAETQGTSHQALQLDRSDLAWFDHLRELNQSLRD